MRRFIVLLGLFFAMIAVLIPAVSYSREKITLAVLDFEAKNIDQQKADGVTDLLRTELFNTGRFKVVEREKVRKILDEQNFQMSGLTDANQAVEIGRMLNVEKIMVGTVTVLGRTHVINTRMVDVQSGLVSLAESVESSRGEEGLLQALVELSMNVALKVGMEGSIIRIDKKEVFIDLGSTDGVKDGQIFQVFRSGDVITDLEGNIIGAQEEQVGIVTISKVNERFSVAAGKTSTKGFMKGDKVKPASADIPQPAIREQSKRTKPVEDDQKPEVPIIF